LADRAQEILDDRVRVVLDVDIRYKGMHDCRWFVCSGWQERSEALYAAAAAVSRRRDESRQGSESDAPHGVGDMVRRARREHGSR